MLASSKPEQLLELIDDNKNIVILRNSRLPHRVHQTQRAAAKGRLQENLVGAGELTLGPEHLRCIE